MGLGAIIVPTSPSYEKDRLRAETAVESGRLNGNGHYVISGKRNDGMALRDSQPYNIYLALRSHGIRPAQMMWENQSTNSAENIRYSLSKLMRTGHVDIGISSYPKHLDRFEQLYEDLKENEQVSSTFILHRVETK